jgi:hypothetical protein
LEHRICKHRSSDIKRTDPVVRIPTLSEDVPMPPPCTEKKGLIERELLRCATAKPMERPTYTEFGLRVGIPKQGPWQPVLDAIANEADKAGEPDLTMLIRNARTNYPSRIGRVTTREPNDEQKRFARKKMQEIIEKYNPETPNPFG